MQSKTLKQILLEPWTERTPALFDSQRTIAKAIAARQDSRYSGREASLRTFLNQVLNKGRPCPDELAAELIAVAADAAAALSAKGFEVPTEIETVIRAKMKGDDSTSSQSVTDLLLRQLRAQEVVIINPSTLEGRGHPKAPEFQKAMLAATLDPENPARYVFLFDETDDDERLRHEDQTVSGIASVRQIGREDAQQKFHELTTGPNPVIRICRLKPELCIVPIVAFDPGSSFYKADLFVWDWSMNDDGKVTDHIAKLSNQTKKKWLRDFYFRYVRRDTPMEASYESQGAH